MSYTAFPEEKEKKGNLQVIFCLIGLINIDRLELRLIFNIIIQCSQMANKNGTSLISNSTLIDENNM